MAMVERNGHTSEAQLLSPIYAHIVGWGMAVPENVMSNDDLAAIVETDDEWIRSRTGIRQRHIATEKESTATLGYQAAKQALDTADILPVDLDMIIVATSTPEHIFPSTASLIQDWLGASKAGAFDLSAACSGFVYALNMGAQAIRSGSVRTALVIGSETMSRVLDWQDRKTCILFGDGAGAVVLRASDVKGGVLSNVMRSDGAGADLLAIPTQNVRELNGHKLFKMHMSGGEVFKFATRVVDESIREAVQKAGITLDDVALVVPHQANQRILKSASRKLGISMDRWMSNLDRYANTSAASIPIALYEAIQQGRVKEDDYVVFVGFGGGLSWAASVIQWSNPEISRRPSLNKQRRKLSYFLATWRRRVGRWRRRLRGSLRTFQRKQGRAQRLESKAKRHNL